MIWLTWRQARTQVVVAAAGAVVFVMFLAATGPHLLDDYRADQDQFLTLIRTNRLDVGFYLAGVALMYAVPPLLGAFWGAPLIARELEAGTHRLVWNQGITRSRWLAVKLAGTVAAATAVSAALSLALFWWASPIDRSIDQGRQGGRFALARMIPAGFGARGVVPVGYTVFALILGVVVGLVVRRSVPAIALTLTLMVALQVAMPLFVRPHLMAPVRQQITITAENLRGLMIQGDPSRGPTGPVKDLRVASSAGPADWELSNRTANAGGAILGQLPSWVSDCVPAQAGTGAAIVAKDGQSKHEAQSQACFARLADEGYHQVVTYQPASGFWALQWRETALLLVASALLAGFCFWRINRDLA